MQGSTNPGSPRTFSYGPSEYQVGDLYLPSDVPRPAVVCVLHGGFWRIKYGRNYIAPVARDLARRGFAVWNLEYRRMGAAGGGWPGTLQDVGSGIDYLATLTADGIAIDLDRVTVIGHSAGGHLALWSAQRDESRNNGYGPKRVKVAAAVGLAAVADLARAYELGCGDGAVNEFLDGSPSTQAERYRTSSPIAMLPLGVKQLLLHGTADDTVPIEISRRYAHAALAAGDNVRLIELMGADHMDFVKLSSEAHTTLCSWLLDGP
jgi:acetyl esterase/lipase